MDYGAGTQQQGSPAASAGGGGSQSATRGSPLGSFGLVIAADVLYGPHLFPALLALLRAHAQKGATVLVALSHRNLGPAPSETEIREANTPARHPFFLLAAADGWGARSVCFTANIEVIEMERS
jgi:hypothetical protein